MRKSKAQRIVEMLAEGMRPKDIARKLRVPQSYVGVVRRRVEGEGYRNDADSRYEVANIIKIREQTAERMRRWRAANPERAREVQRRYRENKEKRAEAQGE